MKMANKENHSTVHLGHDPDGGSTMGNTFTAGHPEREQARHPARVTGLRTLR
jgi:hypothetical protein